MPAHPPRHFWGWLVLFAAIGTAIWLIPGMRRAATESFFGWKELTGVSTAETPAEVAPGQLWAAYSRNPVEADRVYTGRLVLLTGRTATGREQPQGTAQEAAVLELDLIDPLDSPMTAAMTHEYVTCLINPAAGRAMKSMSFHQTYRLVGRCEGARLGAVVVTDCRLVP